jgi:uncharacterized membrane protein (UPF0182 family)
LYAQPIYTLRGGTGTGTYPILQFVVISISDQVGIGRSFDEAFANALDLTVNQGGGTENPGGGNNGGGNNGGGGNSGGGSETLEQKETRLLQKASQKYEAAQRAYNNNDLGRYQDLNAQAADLIAEVLALRDGSTSSEGSTDGSSTPSDSTPTDSTPTDSTPTTPGS